MASANLSYTGATGVVAASAYVTEMSASGSSRSVNLRVAVCSCDGYTGGRNGSYSVTCSNSGTSTGTVSCVISGSELDIFNQTFSVSVGSDGVTASIDFSFSATLVSPSAGSKTISGTITQLTLSQGSSSSGLKLYINEAEGTSLTVNRTWSDNGSTGTLSSGAQIWYGSDVFEISAEASDGYELDYYTFSGTSLGFSLDNFQYTSDKRYTLASEANATVTTTAKPKQYILSISEEAGADVQVIRISTKYSGASTGLLTNGMAIYHFDQLEITYETDAGYNTVVTIGSTTISDGDIYEVTGATKVVATTSVKSYDLTLVPDTGSTIAVYRTSSPLENAATGLISSATDGNEVNLEGKIYYSDVLRIDFSSSAEYEIQSSLVNDVPFESGGTHTVTKDVYIATITGLFGVAYIYDGSAFSKYLIYIYDGSGWSQYIPYIYNGSNWEICS